MTTTATTATVTANQQRLERCQPGQVARSLTNPRGREFTKAADWPEFVESVRTHGVQQPPLVRPLPAGRAKDAKGAKYELVAGERRTTAAVAAGLPEFNVLVADLSDAQCVEIQQVENLQRSDLTALEEAQGYADWRDSLLKAGACKTVEAAVEYIAGKVSRKRSAVFARLALLRLHPPVRVALLAGKISASVAGEIAKIPDKDAQENLLRDAIETDTQHPWSVRDVKDEVERVYVKSLQGAPFDPKRVYAAVENRPGCPSCAQCPKRSGNMKDLFPDFKNDHVCTDPGCFNDKVTAHVSAALGAAKAKGQRVLTHKEWEQERAILVQGQHWSHDFAVAATWEQLMGKHAPQPILAHGPDNQLIETWTRKEALEAAEKNGNKAPEKKKVTAPAPRKETPADIEARKRQVELEQKQRAEREKAQREAQELSELREETANTVAPRLMAKLEAMPQDAKTEAKFWQFVMSRPVFADNLGGFALNAVYARRKIKAKNLAAAVSGMKLPQLRSFIVEVLIGGDLVVGGDEYADEFGNACEFAGIDLKKEEATIKASRKSPVLKLEGDTSLLCAATKLTSRLKQAIQALTAEQLRQVLSGNGPNMKVAAIKAAVVKRLKQLEKPAKKK